MRRASFDACLVLAGSTASFISTAFAQDQKPEEILTNNVFGYVVVFVVLFCILIGLATIRAALINSEWSLSDALSEESEVTLIDDATKTPKLDREDKPIMVQILCPSTSRFIAMIGLVAIVILYIGFGIVLLKQYSDYGKFVQPADIKNLMYFLLGGVTMFAPYLINKFASVFDWLTPKKP